MPSMKLRKLEPFGVELEGSLRPDSLRALILKYGLVVIKNFEPSSKEELIKFASNLSAQPGEVEDKLLHWEFGPLMEMKFNPQAKNYLFSNEEVPLHWDGAFHEEPLFLLFHCTESLNSGGQTQFCHTQNLFENLSFEQKEQAFGVKLKYKTEKLAHYGGEITVPLVRQHPISGNNILRFAEEVKTSLNPVERTLLGGNEELIERINKQLPTYTYSHVWAKNDLVLADNYTLIHGRKELGPNTKRSFSRLQIL